jgi:hypothetical protein
MRAPVWRWKKLGSRKTAWLRTENEVPNNCAMNGGKKSTPVRAGFMKLFLIVPAVLTFAGYAQDKPKPQDPPAQHPIRRLDSVTWNPVTAELSWVVSTWDPSGTATQPSAKETYSMSIDAAQMKFHGEGRGFDPVEAKHVRVLMDMIAMYAVESTVWWESGQGEKLDDPFVTKPDSAMPAPDGAKPSPDAAKPSPGAVKPDKGNSTPVQPGPKAAPVVLRGPVAAASPSGAPNLSPSTVR